MLDQELKLHVKAMDQTFDPDKLSFILEAKGIVQEEEVVKAQSRIASAFQASIAAAHKLFMHNLEGDQVEHRRKLSTVATDTERTRVATISALQDCSPQTFDA
eukprot:Skav225424  [mRNA]  locus=scaffold680:210541:210849:+ [translate_table: standard]